MLWWLNLQTAVACTLCLAGAVIKDGWWRLGIELMGQFFLTSVLAYYTFIVWQKVGLHDGLSLGIALAAPLGVAAAIRSVQIGKTILDLHKAIVFSAEQADR